MSKKYGEYQPELLKRMEKNSISLYEKYREYQPELLRIMEKNSISLYKNSRLHRPALLGFTLLAVLLSSATLCAQEDDSVVVREFRPQPEGATPPPLAESRRQGRQESLALGLVLGLNRSILGAPEDPAGEPQFMSGTAFNGFGFAVGPSLRFGLLEFLAVRLDVLLSLDRATGFEKLGEQERELEMSTWRLRLPLQILGAYQIGPARLELGLGPELAMPLFVDASLVERNIPADASFPLVVGTGPSFGLRSSLGVAFQLADKLWLPTHLHLSWFPGVPNTSRERFEGFVSFAQPGRLRVDYDWCVSWDVGLSYELW